MGSILSKGALFPAELQKGMINMVKGASALAELCGSTPIAFNGQTEFVFDFDNEIDIVAENGAKGVGGASITTRSVVPFKVEYGMRISDEFMQEDEDYQLEVLKAFAEGWSRKLAKGLDLMAVHGINPRTGAASTIIGDNCFDKAGITLNTASADPDADAERAITEVQANEIDVTGAYFAPAFRSALAALKGDDGHKLYPELAWGSAPGSINGLPVQVNSNLAYGSSKDLAIFGNFRDYFKWGYAKQMPIEIIEYGNPDNSEAGDLKGHNQVYLRGEAYLGFSVLDPKAFSI